MLFQALLSPETLSHPTFNQVPPGRTLPSSEFLLRVLKNLGRWLGKLVVTTKSFLSKTDIDLKSLIVEVTYLPFMVFYIVLVTDHNFNSLLFSGLQTGFIDQNHPFCSRGLCYISHFRGVD